MLGGSFSAKDGSCPSNGCLMRLASTMKRTQVCTQNSNRACGRFPMTAHRPPDMAAGNPVQRTDWTSDRNALGALLELPPPHARQDAPHVAYERILPLISRPAGDVAAPSLENRGRSRRRTAQSLALSISEQSNRFVSAQEDRENGWFSQGRLAGPI
jgi:hypothetical protein